MEGPNLVSVHLKVQLTWIDVRQIEGGGSKTVPIYLAIIFFYNVSRIDSNSTDKSKSLHSLTYSEQMSLTLEASCLWWLEVHEA